MILGCFGLIFQILYVFLWQKYKDMKLTLDLNLHSLFSSVMEEERFMTSLDVIREVMNVPQCALNSILRANGYAEVEPGSICIDEEMLSVFADAYIRKMKNYFLSSVRNIENLSYEEFTDLDEFYNTFKNQNVKFVRRAEWSQIDTELIRDAFMDKIKELTPRKKSRFELFLERISGRRESFTVCHELAHILIKESCSEEECCLLDRVTHNRFYLVRQKVKKVFNCSVNIVRQFFVAARYHIFVADDVDANGGLNNQLRLSLMYHLNSNNYEYREIDITYKGKQLIEGR